MISKKTVKNTNGGAPKKIAEPKTWSRMNKQEKKIALCQDVIAQIKAGILTINTGAYVNIPYFHLDEKVELNKQLLERNPYCSVCAKGALFITDIIKRNHYKITNTRYIDSHEIIDRLKNVFSENELDLIETAFELTVINTDNEYLSNGDEDNYGGNYTYVAKEAVKFGEKYDDSEKRLIAIMKNIIKNGNFLNC